MANRSSAAEVIYDTSHTYVRRPGSKSSQWRNTSHTNAHRPGSKSSQWGNFMSPNLADMYRSASSTRPANNSDSEDEEMDVRKILKDIEYLGSSNMSWKERKALESQKVVALGGKPPKKQRLPLSVAKVPMKRQKLREQKKLEEDMLLGRFQNKRTDQRSGKRKPEDSALMSSEGYFKKGVLNVKHLLGSSRPKNDIHMSVGNRKKKGKGKMGKNKKKH